MHFKKKLCAVFFSNSIVTVYLRKIHVLTQLLNLLFSLRNKLNTSTLICLNLSTGKHYIKIDLMLCVIQNTYNIIET